jgi:predicted RNA methylase
MRVDEKVLAVLSRCACSGNVLVLPEMLARRDYQAVAKVIEAAGGKWDRRAKAHLFGNLEDCGAVVDQVLLTGEIVDARKELGFFATPPAVVARLLAIADVRRTHRVLEPSAGEGAIAEAIVPCLRGANQLTMFEIDRWRVATLAEKFTRDPLGPVIFNADFLDAEPTPMFDAIVMNPPFAKQADIDHVRHAMNFLADGGRLVAVMSAGITFREDAKARVFRQVLHDLDAEVESLPPDSFKPSGTGVNAVVVSFDWP